MRGLRYIFLCVILLTTATTYVYSQSWDMFFNKGKEHYDKGNYEKAIKNFELYLKYESDNPKAEVKQLLEQAKKRLAEKAETPTNSEQVAKADIAQLTEKPSPKVTEQPTQAGQPHEAYFIEDALGLNMKMIYVEGGTFMMGAPDDDKEADDYDKPQHQVTLDSYYIAEFEVTQSQWEKVMGTTLSEQEDKGGKGLYYTHNDCPMYFVNWEEAKEFCTVLRRLTGKNYTLPTEAQWEFAARGGNLSKNYKYSGSNNANRVAHYFDRSLFMNWTVGTRDPNELGLYDMSGSVYEWCDGIPNIYPSNPPNNIPNGYRLCRGGSWMSPKKACLVYTRGAAKQDSRDNDIGFRVVCLP